MSLSLINVPRSILKKIGIYRYVYFSFFSLLSFWYRITNILKKKFFSTAVILTYHRIDKVRKDPRLLCVTPENFDSHLLFLKENYIIISLTELIVKLRDKKLTGKEAVITFDDGYEDNLKNALPLLEKYNIPATIFVTTGFLGQTANFPWDLEYSSEDRAKFLTQEAITKLAKHPLITIGAHTNTHPRLYTLDYNTQHCEIITSFNTLSKLTNKKIQLFAYPFGGLFDFTKNTQKILTNSGFLAGCTTIPKLVTYTSNLTTLPRINIRNYPASTLSKNIHAT